MGNRTTAPSTMDNNPTSPWGPMGNTMVGVNHTVTFQARDRGSHVTVPADLRRKLNWENGRRLSARVDGGSLIFESLDDSPVLYTIGYQGRKRDDMIEELVNNGVSILIDVRRKAFSNRPDMRRYQLSRDCFAAGITYMHAPEFGPPTNILDSVKSSRKRGSTNVPDHLKEAYRNYLETLPMNVFKSTKDLVGGQKSCLLCYEKDPNDCHRSILAEFIVSKTRVEHL